MTKKGHHKFLPRKTVRKQDEKLILSAEIELDAKDRRGN